MATVSIGAHAAPWYTEAGIATQGYDPVAYFSEGRAVRGDVDFHYKWDGVTWLFASAANRDTFAAEPEKYAPQYGGHCSMAMAGGKKSRGSGEAWSIQNGKLYLNGNTDVRDRWLLDPSKYIARADDWWPRVKDD
ncbi:MAG: YHS domain-containing (seleno)protein [Novosphingobium sp.]